MELTWIVKNCVLNSDKKVMEVSLVFINSVPVLSAGMKQPVGGVLGSIFAGYVSLASQNPYPIKVYSVANYRPHLSHFWANGFLMFPTWSLSVYQSLSLIQWWKCDLIQPNICISLLLGSASNLPPN